jgi:hypothetical protein
MKKAVDFLGHEGGAIAVIFGLLLPALLGVAALAIEVGHWYTERDKLQIAADTAAYSALVSYSIDKDLDAAKAVGVAQAQASGFSGTLDQIEIAIPSPDGTLGPNSSQAILETNPRLYLSAMFLEMASIEIGVVSYATFDDVQEQVPCMLALKPNQSRSIVMAASVQVNMDCVVASNSSNGDAIWAEGTASLTASCIKTPGSMATNGGARITATDCPNGQIDHSTSTDPFADKPFWGGPGIPDTPTFVDQSVSQGRYGVGMPAGDRLNPGKYGKQVEIDGSVTLAPGVYYFSAGFRATPGSRITGEGVTIFVNQTKVLDIAQNVRWNLTAPTSGPTAGISIMGNPAITGGTVRLIGVIGNVGGAIYFPNQLLQTESGPNLPSARCTQVIANLIDIRGGGTINNDCSSQSGASTGASSTVRLAKGPLL